MSVEEALAQMKDLALMEAAMVAYKMAGKDKGCEECCLMIGDQIRSLMRPQR